MLLNLKKDGHTDFMVEFKRMSVELEAKEPIETNSKKDTKIWISGIQSKRTVTQKGFIRKQPWSSIDNKVYIKLPINF